MVDLLIDSDSIIYRAGYANEERFYHVFSKDNMALPIASVKYKNEANSITNGSDNFVVEKEVVVGPLENALANAKRIIEYIKTSCKSENATLFLTDSGETLKHKLAVTVKYKGNRDPLAKPKQYKEIREYIEKNYSSICVKGFEADDVIYSYATKLKQEFIIVSIDKDLQLIPGQHFNFVTGVVTFITQKEAEVNFFRLMLTGDAADNIKGIDKVGPVTANRILGDSTDLEATVKEQYKKAFGEIWEARYNENYALIKLHDIHGGI